MGETATEELRKIVRESSLCVGCDLVDSEDPAERRPCGGEEEAGAREGGEQEERIRRPDLALGHGLF